MIKYFIIEDLSLHYLQKNFHKLQIIAYEAAIKAIKNSKYQTLNIQNLSDKYIVLEQEKTALMQEYSSQNSMLHKLQQAKKNMDLYLDNHLEK